MSYLCRLKTMCHERNFGRKEFLHNNGRRYRQQILAYVACQKTEAVLGCFRYRRDFVAGGLQEGGEDLSG